MNTNHKFEDAVSDICRLTLKAQLDAPVDREKREDYYKRFVEDILLAISNFDVEPKAEVRPRIGEVKEPKQNLDLIPGVRMVHFRGPNYNRFVAVRKHPTTPWGYTQEPNVYEISVNRDTDVADVYVDGRSLFRIVGDSVGHCTVSKVALSALRRYLKERLYNSRASKRARARRAAAEGKEA